MLTLFFPSIFAISETVLVFISTPITSCIFAIISCFDNIEAPFAASFTMSLTIPKSPASAIASPDMDICSLDSSSIIFESLLVCFQ